MKRWQLITRWIVASVGAVAAIVAMLLWLAGAFEHKIEPNQAMTGVMTPLGERPVVNTTTMKQPYAE